MFDEINTITLCLLAFGDQYIIICDLTVLQASAYFQTRCGVQRPQQARLHFDASSTHPSSFLLTSNLPVKTLVKARDSL